MSIGLPANFLGGIVEIQMSALSVFDRGVVLCASPIYPTCELEWRDGAAITFEILAADATGLRHRLGEEHHYMLESQACLGKLTRLEECQSTVPALLFLRHKPTMCGTMTILKVGTPTST